MRLQRTTTITTVLAAALLLGACAASEDRMASFFVAPGKFEIYNCPQLVAAAKANLSRQAELRALMVRAGTDTAGQMVSATTYRPEYLQLRGEMNDLRQVAREKKCTLPEGAPR